MAAASQFADSPGALSSDKLSPSLSLSLSLSLIVLPVCAVPTDCSVPVQKLAVAHLTTKMSRL
jgi:hypothetical protein